MGTAIERPERPIGQLAALLLSTRSFANSPGLFTVSVATQKREGGRGGWSPGLQRSSCSDVDPQLPETASLPHRILTGAQLTTGNCCFPTIALKSVPRPPRPRWLRPQTSCRPNPPGPCLAQARPDSLSLGSLPPRFHFPASPLLLLASRSPFGLIGRRSGKYGGRICTLAVGLHE